MELPTYDEFGKLRLRRFVSRRIRALKDWEYEEELWVGEACGFTEVLRLARDPKVVRSVAVDLTDLPSRAQARLWNALGVPLRHGMTSRQIFALLGRPRRTKSFVPNRLTYEFRIGSRWRYRISCTVLEKGGLVYFTMLAPTKR